MFAKSPIEDVRKVIDALNERRVKMVHAALKDQNSIDAKKYTILTNLNISFEKVLQQFENRQSSNFRDNNLATYICLMDIFNITLNLDMQDLKTLCTQRSNKGAVISAGFTIGGTVASFALLGPAAGIATFFLMASEFGLRLKSSFGINTASPKSAQLFVELMDVCGKKMAQIAKEQSKHQNNSIETLLCEKDPFQFVTAKEMPKSVHELKDACCYICFDDNMNQIDVVYKNSKGNRCTFQAEVQVNKTGIGAEIGMEKFYTIVIMLTILKQMFYGEVLEHENEHENEHEKEETSGLTIS